MDPRKELILNTIIKEHIKTGAPVGSGILVEKYKLDISPATARNEMADLEAEGYIVQPHTSAGRIPTEIAYNYYLQKMQMKKISKSDKDSLEEILKENTEESFKNVAKHLSQLSGVAVFWAFHRHNLYYTGISNLFQQPEFSRLNIIFDISAIIDRIDEIINEVFSDIPNGLDTKIGTKSPFGDFSGSIMAKYKFGEHEGLFGLLGPMRMDYERNLALIDFVYNKINNA
ncbi:MAG: Transcriptional regulator of heat shock protein [Candidatus Falkowbacteria bacterium GW2011_GWC2_38_22]|uniref:Transcriptional regulator of heat shock protein n=1 Tax=Candidatus Falkowbacteria bacterium GW2011_GWE1_38_31 TaxID=1618638 RepID=A0A0G0K4H5_9BACT|nr:MAG: Transcriptional regulator of heat shock protein [Candidatus Falkowbacteria bacterium GW2011_GWF2_38_1205]KKQ61521.1 MAG: Transcriptional regulator of heat shock protein [Candidatus Falkowbacteria bacterium GW2011_GWC2_38_22]KKQ63586.1 MAG: Transcriptional regulator of heat shock protein [Candidatus Falkowbacteria bacterium GW2011_GWF1_38_22]KKQ65738.1 MAG: Transcriptional regulator of heat shock protein [Candidatus Falkowbacteria bacterium GW2011_GWE2_38_254]KKQ70355.1 MAG: Transcriptio